MSLKTIFALLLFAGQSLATDLDVFYKKRRSSPKTKPAVTTDSIPSYVGTIDEDGWEIAFKENDCAVYQKDNMVKLVFAGNTLSGGKVTISNVVFKPELDALTLRKNSLCNLDKLNSSCTKGVNVGQCQ